MKRRLQNRTRGILTARNTKTPHNLGDLILVAIYTERKLFLFYKAAVGI